MRQISQLRSTANQTTTTAMFSLTAAALLALTGCPGGEEDDDTGPEALVSLHGQVASSALTADQTPAAQGLEAYLFWIGDQAVIDHAGMNGAVGASFQLSIYDEPAASSFLPDYPEIAAAQIVAMTPDTANTFMQMIAAQQSGEEPEQLAAGTVFGLTEFWVVFSRADGAVADLLPGLKQGFNLIGPDLEARACADGKWVDYDACFSAEGPACDALLNDSSADDAAWEAYDACINNACADELAAIDSCGPTITVVPLDTAIQVNLNVMPDYSEEEVTAEEG